MADYFRAGDETTVTFVLNNAPAITPTDAKLVVQDENGVELFNEAALPETAFALNKVTVTVPPEANVLPDDAPFGVRLLSLWVKGPGMSSYASYEVSYALMATDPLVVQRNSFQNYASAIATAAALPSGEVSAFEATTRLERVKALHAAWLNLCGLNYSFGRTDLDRMTRITEHPFGSPGNVAELTADELQALPERFLAALRRAQVVEADALLRVDDSTADRARGLVTSKVGEVSQTYRASKPLELSVNRRTYKYLLGYINHNPRLARH